MSYYKALIAKR